LVPAMREKISTYLPALQATWSGGIQEIFSYCSLK
jgi:hypothetical protein